MCCHRKPQSSSTSFLMQSLLHSMTIMGCFGNGASCWDERTHNSLALHHGNVGCCHHVHWYLVQLSLSVKELLYGVNVEMTVYVYIHHISSGLFHHIYSGVATAWGCPHVLISEIFTNHRPTSCKQKYTENKRTNNKYNSEVLIHRMCARDGCIRNMEMCLV